MKKVLSHQASKTISFPELNHLFQLAKTGAPEEYVWIETTFEQGAMEAIANWLDSLSFQKRQASINGYLPTYAYISNGKKHDVTIARKVPLSPYSIVAMDRGYNDYNP